ncbi:MAG TPA: peptide chain release factor 1, partial [Pantanalinema sp.]
MLEKIQIDKLHEVERTYHDLGERLSDPAVLSDQEQLRKYAKARSDMEVTVEFFHAWQAATQQLADAQAMRKGESDPELRELIEAEIEELAPQIEELERKLTLQLLPRDPNDDKNIIIELRGGAGGDEANLFAGDLLRMYTRYADSRGWKVEVMDLQEQDLGGIKEASLLIKGDGVYSRMKWESGVHRVQRVPATEAQGRIHTSTATVAVLPEAEAVDIEINNADLRWDTFRSGGAGGQNVNKVESGVRVTHVPTGLAVACTVERSQLQNKARALELLRTRLLDAKVQAAESAYASERKSQVGTGDRSERIRTYNFPENRVSDHRIKLTLNKLDRILNGDLDEVIDALISADQSEKLAQLTA